MKSISFKIENAFIECSNNPGYEEERESPYVVSIELPLLPAYSIEYLSVNINGMSAIIIDYDIEGSVLNVFSDYQLLDIDEITIVLHYHGIRDYGLLFPRVTSLKLKERLGRFYEEAEKSFEQGTWLCFTLMCGAVFEGMLHAKLNPDSTENTFSEMIANAHDRGVINDAQRSTMNIVRKSRNLVHANKVEFPYVSRKDAMDIRATLDKLIKEFSY